MGLAVWIDVHSNQSTMEGECACAIYYPIKTQRQRHRRGLWNGHSGVGGLGKEQRWRTEALCCVPAFGPRVGRPPGGQVLLLARARWAEKASDGETSRSGAAQPGGVRERAEPASNRRGHRLGKFFSRAAPRWPHPPFGLYRISTWPRTRHWPSQYQACGCRVVPGDCTHAGVCLAAAASGIGLFFEEYLYIFVLLIFFFFTPPDDFMVTFARVSGINPGLVGSQYFVSLVRWPWDLV